MTSFYTDSVVGNGYYYEPSLYRTNYKPEKETDDFITGNKTNSTAAVVGTSVSVAAGLAGLGYLVKTGKIGKAAELVKKCKVKDPTAVKNFVTDKGSKVFASAKSIFSKAPQTAATYA